MKILDKINKWQLKIRKWKLKTYKRKKVRKEKTPFTRNYYISFKIKIDDQINPQENDVEYNMVVSGNAAFFAKKKLLESLRGKLSIEVSEIEEMSDREHEDFLESKEKYINSNN